MTYADRPWERHYKLGPFPLKKTLLPYPELSVPEMLERTAWSYPDRPAIWFLEKQITYKELKLLVDKLATALADLGVEKGDRVATILPNCPQFVISDFAVMEAGGVLVPCSTLHKAADLIHEIGGSGAKIVICQEDSLELVNSIMDKSSIRKVIVTDPMEYSAVVAERKEIQGAIQFRDLIKEYDANPPEVDIIPEEDLSDVIFTGGATGIPKGVMKTHQHRVNNVMQGLNWCLEPLSVGLKGKSSILLAVPIFHEYGRLVQHFCVLWGLQTIMMADPRDIDTLKELLYRFRPMMCAGVPTQYSRLLEKGLDRTQTTFFASAQALAPEIAMAIDRATGMTVNEGYGLTETGFSMLNLSAFAKMTGFAQKLMMGSLGVPMVDVDLKIVDPDTHEEIPVGQEGEIWVKTPSVMLGYWPTPGQGLIGDWFPTGDVGRMDETGYFFLTDRIKDMANISGMKVYTRLVDDVIYELPGVQDAITIAIPDPSRPGSERLKSFIKLRDGSEVKLTPEQVIEYCKGKLAAYSVPSAVEIGAEDLPMTPAMKLNKRALRERELNQSKRVSNSNL